MAILNSLPRYICFFAFPSLYRSPTGRERVQGHSRRRDARQSRQADFSKVSGQGRVRADQCQLAQYGRRHSKHGQGRGTIFPAFSLSFESIAFFNFEAYYMHHSHARHFQYSLNFVCVLTCACWKSRCARARSFRRRSLPSARPRSST